MNLIRPLWFTWKGKDGYGSGGGYLQIKIFYYLLMKKHRENGKSTGKRQGKHREFGINWSVATLIEYQIDIVRKYLSWKLLLYPAGFPLNLENYEK